MTTRGDKKHVEKKVFRPASVTGGCRTVRQVLPEVAKLRAVGDGEEFKWHPSNRGIIMPLIWYREQGWQKSQSGGETSLKPLEQFVCDTCGLLIEKVEDGWLEWLNDYEHPAHGFRIVHAGRSCYYPDHCGINDNHLVYFTGSDGLSLLLGLFQTRNGVNINEVIEIIRRLHVPYYEEARRYWDKALSEGMVDNKDFRQADLVNIIKEYSRE